MNGYKQIQCNPPNNYTDINLGGFLAHTVVITNPTGAWWYLPNPNIFIQPYESNTVINLNGLTSVDILFQAPLGIQQSTALTGYATFNFYEDDNINQAGSVGSISSNLLIFPWIFGSGVNNVFFTHTLVKSISQLKLYFLPPFHNINDPNTPLYYWKINISFNGVYILWKSIALSSLINNFGTVMRVTYNASNILYPSPLIFPRNYILIKGNIPAGAILQISKDTIWNFWDESVSPSQDNNQGLIIY